MVRRDQSISLSDKSKMRNADFTNPGAAGKGRRADDAGATGTGSAGVAAESIYFTRYWNTAARLSSGEVTSSMEPNCPLAAISVRRA